MKTGDTKMTTIAKDIQDIKITLAGINEHLKSMNGQIITCTKHVNTNCPTNRKDIYDKVDTVKENVNKINNTLAQHKIIYAVAYTIMASVLVAVAVSAIGK